MVLTAMFLKQTAGCGLVDAVDVYRDIIICICLTNKMICLYICIQIEGPMWVWFIKEAMLNHMLYFLTSYTLAMELFCL